MFPLLCPRCGGQIRIIAFITYSADICQILDHIGADAEPPRITPARGPPLWDGADVPKGEGVEVEPGLGQSSQACAPGPQLLSFGWISYPSNYSLQSRCGLCGCWFAR